MKSAIHGTYPFNPLAKTLNLSSVTEFDFRSLYAVLNLTTNTDLYLVGDATATATESNGVVTFNADTTGMSSNDKLMILYDIDTYTAGEALSGNSTVLPLSGNAVFTGVPTEVHNFSTVVVSCKTDQRGTLSVEFSVDGETWDSTMSYVVSPNVNEVHRLTITKRYIRIRFINGPTTQTFLRLDTLAGNHPPLSSPINSVVQTDADSLTVRPIDFNLMLSQGLFQNHGATIKDGLNASISTSSVPEDIINEGGIYAGFPLGSPEQGQIVVSGNDIGTVFYTYLLDNTSQDYVMGSVAVNGAGTYNLPHNIWRCNYAWFVSANQTSMNVGGITVRNTPTTTNIFAVIQAGYGQSYCAAYTVPANSSIYIDRFSGNMRGSTSGTMDGAFWYRPLGESPRFRFPFELQYGTLYFDDVDFLIKAPAGVDMVPRIIISSANNLNAKFSYRFVKVIGE